MSSTFLFLLCLMDIVTAAVLLTTGYNIGIGVTMLVAGCLVSLVGLMTLLQVPTVTVNKSAYMSKSLTRR